MQQIAQSRENAGDKLFLLETAKHNQFEMKLSEAAERKSQNDQVKQLAARIIEDHRQASQRLQQVAQKQQIQLPQTLPQAMQTKIQIYEAMEPEAFDKEYIACMDAAHAHDVTAFRHAARNSKIDEVKQFASQTLPKLQEHHQQTRMAAAAIGIEDDGHAQPAGGRLPGATPSRQPGEQGGPGAQPGREPTPVPDRSSGQPGATPRPGQEDRTTPAPR